MLDRIGWSIEFLFISFKRLFEGYGWHTSYIYYPSVVFELLHYLEQTDNFVQQNLQMEHLC